MSTKEKRKSDPSAESIWDKFAAIRPSQPAIPANAVNRKEYMKQFALTEKQAINELEVAVQGGRVATAMGRGVDNRAERKYWLA